MASFREFIKSIQNDGNDGKVFEHFCKWFLRNDPVWKKEVQKVWLWDEWPDRWGPDNGIDLILKHRNGEIWAVQAKCYDPSYTLTKSNIDSFISESGRSQIDKRLLMASCEISAKVSKTFEAQEKAVVSFTLPEFEQSAVDYPLTYAELSNSNCKPKPQPRAHQLEAVGEAVKGFQAHDRGQVILPCGTGKTFTTLWIKERLNANTTLVLLPSLNLLSQTLREWAWAANDEFEILNVCSDKSVGSKIEDMSSSDAPFPVTCDIVEIKDFLTRPNAKIVFCTYHSSGLIAQAQEDPVVPAFDLIVADEAHRCAGSADASFATVLNGDKIRSTKRLFTTATPRFFAKTIRDDGKAKEFEILSMDDETVFGPVLYSMPFGEAIHRNLLTDYQVVIVGVDEPMVKKWIDEQETVSIHPDRTTNACNLAAKIGLIKAIKDYDINRVISFHNRVTAARDFSEELTDILALIAPEHRPEGAIWSDYVSGQMSAGVRRIKIERLKALEDYDRGILTNARCLSEGIDVPALDGVAFIDPKGSQVDIIQAVGRAIRKSKNKEYGTIVIPVFIEEGDDAEDKIEASRFKPVWDVLKALRAHDEILANSLDQFRNDMAKGVRSAEQTISDKIIFDLPNNVGVEFSIAEFPPAIWKVTMGLVNG